MKKTLSAIRRACEEYKMIEKDEIVCVGVSGGKDSMLLLKALNMYKNFATEPFKIKAICLDMGFGNINFDVLKKYCEELDVELIIEPSQIAQIVFEERAEKNPCALCANLRRGALHNIAIREGSRKLALGHHADDLMETFLMSILYEGRVNTFKAKTYLDRKDITVIRPMIYLKEKDVIYTVNRLNIPVIKSPCPVDKKTKREDMKDLIKYFSRTIPDSEKRIFRASKGYMDLQERL